MDMLTGKSQTRFCTAKILLKNTVFAWSINIHVRKVKIKTDYIDFFEWIAIWHIRVEYLRIVTCVLHLHCVSFFVDGVTILLVDET